MASTSKKTKSTKAKPTTKKKNASKVTSRSASTRISARKSTPAKKAAISNTAKASGSAQVIIGKKNFEFPILTANDGPAAIDMSNLYKDTGYFTYDPGFMSTASCESSITFIDGDKGILRYGGYDIGELAQKSDYPEVCYLLLNGELPTAKQKKLFDREMTLHTMVHEQIQFLFRGFPRRAHPMAILCGSFASLSAFYHDSLDIRDPEQVELSAFRMIAKMPTLAAMCYKYAVGQPFIYPDNDLTLAENFLYMMFATPCEAYEVNPVLARTMDMLFILHADHEQNASTSTVRLASSSGANPFACVGAGIASLWGPAHGGANEAVINMLEEIGDVKNIPEFIKRAKDKNDPFRLMGFGHRVYKNYDPRAAVIRKACHATLKELGQENEPMLKIAMELEKIALEDPYFVERKLYPNVDFYSGIIYRAMGIPTSLFTVMFAVARTAGWVAQWKEMLNDPKQKIGRPRQLFVGSKGRKYQALGQRK